MKGIIQGRGDTGRITGAASTVVGADLTPNKILSSNNNGKIATTNVDASKTAYLANVTSDIQTQINNRQNAVVVDNASSLPENTIVGTNADGKIVSTGIASSYLSGLTGNIQTQINTAKSDIIPLSRGGAGSNLTPTAVNSIMYKNSGTTLNGLNTANGALFATSLMGTPKFGILPVAQGGTGVTSKYTSSSVLTYTASGLDFTINTLRYYPQLDLVFCHIIGKTNRIINTNNYLELGLVPTDYRPSSRYPLSVYVQNHNVSCTVGSNGLITYKPLDTNIPDGYFVQICGIWGV